ncbi:histidine phosphatase family protein [Methylobacterium sp. V23]|uniref:histidine phosphatase family protein n=1 Tax=Methylobacterium sp. V23 TaxID=2044878 RepID=UPI0015E1778A|nr:histidine phosphatase family protein [Methylobacterium sp. V23]
MISIVPNRRHPRASVERDLKISAAVASNIFYRSVRPNNPVRGPTLVVAHGNSLRALVMALEGLGPDEVESLELATGSMRVCEFAEDTSIAIRRLIA